MKKKFSLFDQLNINLIIIENIYDCLKITLGPTGKNGIFYTCKDELTLLTNGSALMKSLEFASSSGNIISKLLEQIAIKTTIISGDGSTTTILFACDLLKNSLRYLINGYNAIFLSNGLKKIAFFCIEKVVEFSKPILKNEELVGILKTSLGKKVNFELVNFLYRSLSQIERDGLILIEENVSSENEIEILQGLELDKGFASSYFINDLKNFEIFYENPYLLITSDPIHSISQIRDIIEYTKTSNRPLIIIAEEITKEMISTLVLNNIQKKVKVAVIRYNSIKFIKTGLLEDLALLTHSHYFPSSLTTRIKYFTKNDLGQADKVLIKKEKATFFMSKFSKVITKRRINELNRELITSETEYEKTLFKTRIARLSGNITKIRIGHSNQYQIKEERQKIENALITIRSALEEGILPGGGSFYLHLRNELKNWSYLNLLGEEVYSSQIVLNTLLQPFQELCHNTNTISYQILKKISPLGYPYAYNLVDQAIVNTFEEGLIDSAKSVRAILWNSLTIISTLIITD
jgi:chaperonin GroEL